MRNLCKKNKLIYFIACLIIIAGAIVYFTKGFKFDMEYAKKDQIVLSNKTGFDASKIQEISKEILAGKEVQVREVEIFKNAVAISAEEIKEEEKAKIIEKVNQEYGLEISADNVKIENIEHARIKDMLAEYVLPIIITFAIILLYFLFRYRKIGVKKLLSEGILLPIVSELEFFSIIAIARIPFGNITIVLAIGIYAAMFVVLASKFDKNIEALKESEKTNK